MSPRTPIRRALVSVSDKRELSVLAEILATHGIETLSTGGTHTALAATGLAVRKVADVTGAPEILSGRVKTLHPTIHAGILARPTAEHLQELHAHGIGAIDLVVVNLYPFEQTVARPGCSLEDAIEDIDIGGPTMVRGAAKNHERVTIVVDPADYVRLGQELAQHGGIGLSLRRALARKAFAHTAAYDAAIAGYLHGLDDEGAPLAQDEAPPLWAFVGRRALSLRYGENPHQAAGLYTAGAGKDAPLPAPDSPPARGLCDASLLQGKELSYNNLLDADAALAAVRDLEPLGTAAVIVKHGTPCGVAVERGGDATAAGALAPVFVAARAADPESAFGGIVAVNAEVDEATARAMAESFFEVVVAPGFSPAARAVLAAKKNLRLLDLRGRSAVCVTSFDPWRVRSVAGGMLVQREDVIATAAATARVAVGTAPDDAVRRDLDLAWRVVKHARSNAIVLAAGGATVAIAGGQTSRVEAVRQCVARAGERAQGAVVASDAFFPFRDSIDHLARAGVRHMIQPGGSVRDEEVIAACQQHGVTLLLTGERHFRH